MLKAVGRALAGAVLVLCCSLALPIQAQTAASSEPAVSQPSPAAEEMMAGNSSRIIDAARALTEALRPIFAAAPGLPTELGKAGDRIAETAGGGLTVFLAHLAAAFVAALGILGLTHWVLSGFRRRHLARADRLLGLGSLSAILGADLLAVLAMVVVTYAAHALWFAADDIASQVAMALIGALVYWRLILIPVDLIVRHRESGARLVGLGNLAARHLRQGASALAALQVFSTAVLRGLFHAGLESASLRLIALGLGVVNAAAALYFIRRVRRATPGAGEIVDEAAPVSAFSAFCQRLWHPLSLAFVGFAFATWVLGVILKDLRTFRTVIDTAGILLAVWVLDVLVGAWLARNSAKLGDDEAGEARRNWQRVIRHCFDVALWLGAAGFLIELWMVRLAGLLPSDKWASMRGSIGTAIATIYAAYVLWQIVFMHTERHMRAPIQANAGSDAPPVATRLQTVLPILRIFMLVTIAVLAGLIALSDLGVNTTSLIAGASIFGLAISFGSQSLVRDIVSGIFFMADDAFRIGEYIDTGKLKGTVEGMSIRSLRLRHQNGQIHVIPFGQIQQVTNFSRDWTTVKFNLQLAHDTDIEKVRKTVKQIGIEMMDDPELASELIAPLKMQGVTEIGPNAVVVRFKFTARPVQPTFIYRAALRRIYKEFREKGIEFANPTVYVQSRTGPVASDEPARLEAMGAAARSLPPAAN